MRLESWLSLKIIIFLAHRNLKPFGESLHEIIENQRKVRLKEMLEVTYSVLLLK